MTAEQPATRTPVHHASHCATASAKADEAGVAPSPMVAQPAGTGETHKAAAAAVAVAVAATAVVLEPPTQAR